MRKLVIITQLLILTLFIKFDIDYDCFQWFYLKLCHRLGCFLFKLCLKIPVHYFFLKYTSKYTEFTLMFEHILKTVSKIIIKRGHQK